MKRRRDLVIELALEHKEDRIPEIDVSNTPRRRNTITDIPSPQAFETVSTTTRKRSKRARSLFLGTHDSEKNAEPLVDSIDEFRSSGRDTSNTMLISSASPHHSEQMSLQIQEPSTSLVIEPQPSTSKQPPFLYIPNENPTQPFLRSGVKTRGGKIRNKGIKILKSQNVKVEADGSVTLTDFPKDLNNEKKIDTMDKNESLWDLDDEMENIFQGVLPQEKEKVPPSKLLTEEDLIKVLEFQENEEERKESDHEGVSDDCLYSDESEDDTQLSDGGSQEANDDNENNYTTSQVTDEWISERNPTFIPIHFTGHEKALKILPETNEPYDYFKLIVTDEFLEMLVIKINNYASKLLSTVLEPKSRIRLWKDVTLPEIKIFFGLLFHMGTIKLNRITDYWRKHPLFNLPSFIKYMSRNRFLLIMRCLNFEDDCSDNNRLSKNNSLINFFNQRMREIYYPSKNLAIDESMLLFRGRLIFRQYLKGKKHPYGIKLYILTDEYGVVMKTIVYAGASDTVVGGANHSEKVVLNLLSDYFDNGYSVYMDNFYNSVNLATKLLTLKTNCTGTLRANRKNNPKDILQKKLKRGESAAKFKSNGICVMKWKDRRDVLMISSEHGSDMTSVTNRRGEAISKPDVVVKYNKYMGGIDHQDQMLAYYSCERKSLRWYKKLGVHVFQQMLYNSYTLHNIFSTKKSFYEYRLQIIMKLLNIDVEGTTQSSGPQNQKVHVLQQCTRKNNGNKKKILRRRCRQCWISKKLRKDTAYFCPDCPEQYGFCLNDCFKIYHNYQ